MEVSPAPVSYPLTLALGTNQGDRAAQLAAARRLIGERIGPLIAVSSVITTPPWGVAEQPDYLNQVIVVRWTTTAAPAALGGALRGLLDLTQAIERELGRTPGRRWGPRTCDVDLVFVGPLRWEDERLSLPHPWWRQRAFVGGLIAAELPADGAHPGFLRGEVNQGRANKL